MDAKAKNKKNEPDEIKPSESIHEFFVMIPVIVDDFPLTSIARSLYIHIARRAGPKAGGGSCFESIENMAAHLGNSKTTIVKAKRELEDFGLIRVTSVKGNHGEFSHDEITVRSLWEVNTMWKNTTLTERKAITEKWKKEQGCAIL